MKENTILQGDCLHILKTFPDSSVDCCVTSPPYYGLRDYGAADQIGIEKTPYEYVNNLSFVFDEVHRVLKDTGSFWLNIGDSYAGSGMNSGNSKPLYGKQSTNTGSIDVRKSMGAYIDEALPKKSLMGIPWRLAFALQERGWILRQDIIWAKPSCMPESVKDRFCRSHEYLFLFTKQPHYYFNHKYALEPAESYDGCKETSVSLGNFEAAVHGRDVTAKRERCPQRGYATKLDETGLSPQRHGMSIETNVLRTKRDVWWINSEPSEVPHYAMFPQKLITPCILCGCPKNGIVLDPFIGSGTTAIVAKKLMRKYIGCEINPGYVKIAKKKIADINPLFD
ncbi:MAG: site-specific DNA-methyltransferase [Spirochaetaceae bacterium]|jgi:DNA modification methylase|nr:site-specific DNA-methyltransferase [Spirochaetaceae bacterium]